MRILTCLALLLGIGVPYHSSCGAERELVERKCQHFLNDKEGVVGSVIQLLGAPDTCKQTRLQKLEFGHRETYNLQWSRLTLTIDVIPPESGIFLIKTNKDYALPKKWFKTVKELLRSKGWKGINWSFDQFPGPNSEHYLSNVQGHNAQVWLERNPSGEITWFRFSFAL